MPIRYGGDVDAPHGRRTLATVATRTAKPKRVVKRPEGTTPLNLNLPAEVMEGLDAWVERLNAKVSGPRWTRTDVVRTTLAKAISERGEKGEAP
jgi:hypothetical protein